MVYSGKKQKGDAKKWHHLGKKLINRIAAASIMTDNTRIENDTTRGKQSADHSQITETASCPVKTR